MLFRASERSAVGASAGVGSRTACRQRAAAAGAGSGATLNALQRSVIQAGNCFFLQEELFFEFDLLVHCWKKFLG